MRWKRADGKKLTDLPLPDGDWFHSPLYLEVRTARAWGMRPSEFWASSDSDQALMIAETITDARMRAWERHLQQEEAEANARRARQRPPRHR